MDPKIIERIVRAIDKIRDIIKFTQDRQKRYANRRRKSVEFEVSEKMFLKIAPIKRFLIWQKRKVETSINRSF